MLKHRIITALILFIATCSIIFYTPPLIFAASWWILCLIALYELAAMYKFNPLQLTALMLSASVLVIGIAFSSYDLSQLIRVISVATWCFAVPLTLLFLPQKFSKLTISVFALAIFIPAYYAVNVLHTFLGSWQLISLMMIAWVADTGAYFVGKACGKRKLAPQISPGKSIEGALGGFLLVIIYLLILKTLHLVDYLPTYLTAFKFASILTAISIVGDLFESWLKRVAKVKDSGTILPGHGGIFDRIDSLVAVLAIAFAIIRGMI